MTGISRKGTSWSSESAKAGLGVQQTCRSRSSRLRRAQLSRCDCGRNGLKQMLLQQYSEAFLNAPDIRVMAKTGFDPGRDSGLLRINFPRMDIGDHRLSVALFNSPKHHFRI